MSAESTKCPRCGLRQGTSLQFCPACGYEFADSAASQNGIPSAPQPKTQSHTSTSATLIPPRSVSNSSSDTPLIPTRKLLDARELFGWRTLAGTVVGMEPMYMAKPQVSPVRFAVKLLSCLVALPFVVAFLIVGFIVFKSWSLFLSTGPRREEPDFLSRVASQILGFDLAGKLFGPKEVIPVRDIRVRDASAAEHLVRISGEYWAGNVAIEDEVEVSGFTRRGTLVFRRGVNRTTRSQILLR